MVDPELDMHDDHDGVRFERAADAVVEGDLEGLRALLLAEPDLARARSPRSHRATLLHYVAANGVEPGRQKVPPGTAAARSSSGCFGTEPRWRRRTTTAGRSSELIRRIALRVIQ